MKINEIIQTRPPVESFFEKIEQYYQTGWKSRYKLIKIPIDTFLSLTPSFTEDKEKISSIKSALGSGKKLSDIPYLYYDFVDGAGQVTKITGHEGRHRAVVLKSMGYKYLPVMLRGPIRWSEQNDEKKFDYVDVWPTKLVGEDGKNVVPFPVERENSSLDYGQISETTVAWKRKGSRLIPKYRCHSGHREGKLVDHPTKCGEFIDLPQSAKMKKTRAKTNQRSSRKIKKIKRVNPYSKLVKKMNK